MVLHTNFNKAKYAGIEMQVYNAVHVKQNLSSRTEQLFKAENFKHSDTSLQLQEIDRIYQPHQSRKGLRL